ncbi:hypothetical protein HanRHA438_Chr17g0821681 [Helianthus annuus]|uniref:Uncharacterized protein n=1 Tax=Helianthus annuus TaxID=4232 RepID=A0A9K3DK98_HELAN|nr:hypothetical protein HanXRQr2_Chr17g0811631 [Helianthus annuus]KAJ0827087.1 hypothetical protein HanRHA438_Chr17g0821681 [Helianthus annuus]
MLLTTRFSSSFFPSLELVGIKGSGKVCYVFTLRKRNKVIQV